MKAPLENFPTDRQREVAVRILSFLFSFGLIAFVIHKIYVAYPGIVKAIAFVAVYVLYYAVIAVAVLAALYCLVRFIKWAWNR